MGTILELVRYGFAGYLIIANILLLFYRINKFPTGQDFYRDFGSISIATILIIGPILGFVIHQIYFAWFEQKESYTKLSRPCLKILYNYFLNKTKSDITNENKVLAQKTCYLVWKYMMTGTMGDLKISEVILSRLTSMRNYSHAFGAIVTSGIISLAIYYSVIIYYFSSLNLIDVIILSSTIFITVLFLFQRYGLIQRIEEIENGIMRLEIERFHEGLIKLMNLEKDYPIYSN